MLKEGTNLRYLPFVIVGLIVAALIAIYVVNQGIVRYGPTGSGSGSGCSPLQKCEVGKKFCCYDSNTQDCLKKMRAGWDPTPYCVDKCTAGTTACDDKYDEERLCCNSNTKDCGRDKGGNPYCIKKCPNPEEPDKTAACGREGSNQRCCYNPNTESCSIDRRDIPSCIENCGGDKPYSCQVDTGWGVSSCCYGSNQDCIKTEKKAYCLDKCPMKGDDPSKTETCDGFDMFEGERTCCMPGKCVHTADGFPSCYDEP